MEQFQCNPNVVDQVTFRARLFAPGNITNTTILSYIQNWLKSQHPLINIIGVDFTVDPSCNVQGATAFEDDFCVTQCPSTNSSIRSTLVLDWVWLLLFVVIIVVIGVFICCTKMKLQTREDTRFGNY